MKKVLFVSLFLGVTMLNAQNFQNICSPGVTFYQKNYWTIKAFRLDGIILALTSGDTIFRSYRTIRPPTVTNCHDTTNGSLLGLNIYKHADGTFHFFNRLGDTITIRSQALRRQPWTFCNTPYAGTIQAKVTNIIMDSVLGVPDSIKVITLQAKDAFGQNTSHSLNGKSIFLSMHFGLTKTFDFYTIPGDPNSFPADTSSYYLAGKSDPMIGVSQTNWKDVYDFDIGDEFHYEGHASGYWNIVKKVLTKTVYGNSDSVRYTFDYCKNGGGPSGNYTIRDTILEKYNFIALASDSMILRLPEEFVPDTDLGYLIHYAPEFEQALRFNGRSEQRYADYVYDTWGHPYCWQYRFESRPTWYYYANGLGRTFHKYFYAEPFWYGTEELVYFKKGLETFGTPVSSVCNTAVFIEQPSICLPLMVETEPNPVETIMRVKVTGVHPSMDLEYALYNLMGKEVIHGEIENESFMINRNGLPAGFFLLLVSDKKKSIFKTQKVIFR